MYNSRQYIPNPDSVNTYQIEEKFFTLFPNTYDIGAYLRLLYIKPHQIIIINLKEGIYSWNENYVPLNSLQ